MKHKINIKKEEIEEIDRQSIEDMKRIMENMKSMSKDG